MVSRLPKLAILAYPGCLQSAVLGLQDVLSYAAQVSGTAFSVDTLTEFGESGKAFDAIILPPSQGEVREEHVPDLAQFVADQHKRGALVCSACTGVTFVAAAGVAQGRPVTTHWGLKQRLAAIYPGVVFETDRLVIEYADLVTAGGLMAWIDLSLAVIERFLGYSVAAQTAGYFVVDLRRRDQRRFRRFSPELRHGDAAVLKAQHFMEARFAEAMGIGDAAHAAGLPGRTFLRRFKAATGFTPTAYLQELRIERARELLIETRKSVSEICFMTGYQDLPSFVRLFKTLTGLTPNAFRKTYVRELEEQKTPPKGGV